jgi:hypothetical protein
MVPSIFERIGESIQILACIVILLFFASCDDGERTESRKLLERLQAIDIHTSIEKRKASVLQLESLILADKKLYQTQQICAKAHRALIEAEEQQVKAKQLLDKVTAFNSNAAISKPDLMAVADGIERSNEQIKRAKESFPSCEREIRRLELRFASAHGLR